MLRSSTRDDRGQTEPLAALIAVSAIALGLGLYAGYVTGALPGTTDRAVEEPTMDRVWHAIEEDGIYHSDEEIEDHVDVAHLPEGHNVYVNVTRIGDDGEVTVVDDEQFDSRGNTVDPPDVPEDAGTATRPIPIAVDDGDVRGGTLRVVVW